MNKQIYLLVTVSGYKKEEEELASGFVTPGVGVPVGHMYMYIPPYLHPYIHAYVNKQMYVLGVVSG